VIAATRPFPDHHPYRRGELATLAAEAQRLGADLVTTEKDAARLPPDFAARVRVLPVRLAFDDVEALRRQVLGALAGAP
jgi:tetraacyldisaccharide 4'-kinase